MECESSQIDDFFFTTFVHLFKNLAYNVYQLFNSIIFKSRIIRTNEFACLPTDKNRAGVNKLHRMVK